MFVIRKLVERIAAIYSKFLFSRSEKYSLLKLKEAFRQDFPAAAAAPLVVVVDGFLAIRFVAIYYLLLLLLVQRKTGRQVKVVVLGNNRCAGYFAASRVYAYFFQVTSICPDDILSKAALAEVDRQTTLLAQQAGNASELFGLRYKGCRIGRDVYYACIRNELIGTLDIVDSRVIDVLRQAVRNYAVAERLIDKFSPEFLLITDNCYAVFSPFFYGFLGRHIPVALTVPFAAGTGKIGGRTYVSLEDIEPVKRRYTFAFNDDTWDEIREKYSLEDDAIVEGYLEQRYSGNDLTYNGDYHKHTSRLSFGRMREALEIPENDCRKKILIAAHLLWDDPGYDGLYRDYEIWLRDTLETIVQNGEVIWILKAHPSEKHMGASRMVRQVVKETFGDVLPTHVRFLDADTDINTYSLIDYVDAVLTVRGTIGFEAACKGKLVISAGCGPYTGLGFVKEFDNQSDYRKYLINAHREELSLSEEKIRNARMGLFGYFIRKTPVSSVLLRGEEMAGYADLTMKELIDDSTLNRFADKLLSKTSGDLL